MLTALQPGGAPLARLQIVTRPAHDKLGGTLGLLDGQLDPDAYQGHDTGWVLDHA